MSKPLQEPTFLVLAALAGGPRHGYAILGEIGGLSSSPMRIGTLYAALDRLDREGLIEVESEEVVNGRLRRTYRLAGAGEAVLAEETARLERLARLGRGRLGGNNAALGTAGA